MSQTDFLPVRDNGLKSWAYAFSKHLNSDPESFGVSAAQAASFGLLSDQFAAALKLTKEPSNNTVVTRRHKNGIRKELVQSARALARQINAAPGITNRQRARLQLTIPSRSRRRVSAPSSKPLLYIMGRTGRRVTILLRDVKNNTSGKRPEGVYGATIFTCQGDEPVRGLHNWRYHASTTRSKVTLVLDPSYEPGTKVWVTAVWLNPRLQRGPAASPVCTSIEHGVFEFEHELRLAA